MADESKGLFYGSAPELARLPDFDGPRQYRAHGAKLRAVSDAAVKLRARFRAGPQVVSVCTLPITTLIYPAKFAFWGAALSPAPFVMMSHRALLVQFLQPGVLKTLLFNPTDEVGSRQAPYFKRMIETVGDFMAFKVLARKSPSIQRQLSDLGVSPEQIDYIAFDHFHTQDLRSLLGTHGGARPRFPNARLLAPRVEWEDWDDLPPMQQAFFVADGKRDVLTRQVVLTDSCLQLGDGVMLIRTPGHTSGNQTLFINTSEGVWGCSENGTCADNWTPLESRIPGLAAHCRRLDVSVLLNSNTPESGAEQYTSMILERALVDRVERAPEFCQMFSSSEVTPSPLAPGLTPSLLHKRIAHGQIARPSPRGDTRAQTADSPVSNVEYGGVHEPA